MLNTDIFFEDLKQHYINKLPFVVYNKPKETVVKSWLQNDDELYTTENFTESGFVFAPFDLKQNVILFPDKKCDFKEVEIETEIEAKFKHEVTFKTKVEKESHINLVSKAIDEINNDELKKVVLSRFETNQLSDVKPIELFKRLFNNYKNALVYCWYHPKVGLWLGATPELLLKVNKQQLTTVSLAGTRTYKENETPNWSTKELQEQQIVTDYLLAQISQYTSTTKISKTETVKAGNLWHLKTRLTSQLSKSSNLKAIINNIHPTPAICGFPKENAKTFVLENENYNREFYTGFLGELNVEVNHEKTSDLYVNLRCMQIQNNNALIYVGGGITKDSLPENEWEETVDKTQIIKQVL